MNYNNVLVTTEGGFKCAFFAKSGVITVVCCNGTSVFENVINSVSKLKIGKPLKFSYYAWYGTEDFESDTPIKSIEKIKED